MQQEDMQKRMLIFFAVISFLFISFSLVSQYLFPEKKKENVQSVQKQEATNQNTPIHTSGNFDLILTNERFNLGNSKNIKVNTKFGYVEFTPFGGRITSVYVEKYNHDMISDFSKKNKVFIGELITSNPDLTKILNFSEYTVSQSDKTITFKLEKENVSIEKIYTITDDGVINLSVKTKGIENTAVALLSGISLNSEGSFGHEGAIIKTDKELIKVDKDLQQSKVIRDNILWAGEENKYFLQIFASKNGTNTVNIIPVAKDTTAVLVNISPDFEGFIYSGAKLYSTLGQITDYYKNLWKVDLDLRSSIDFGFFGILGKPLFLLLHFFYTYIPNWGVAIIILTILIRILFFPLNHKSLKAMKKMADLAPEIEKLKKKYAKDPQKLQEEIMKLYAEAGANPMSGCLPILVQIPVFIALYNVLMVTVELKNAPFILWIKDLSDKDPYYILPILMGLSMVAQQWITPSSDKNQKMIMYIMAGVFTFMFMNFPAGLVLYWFTNNILGLIQSFIINKNMKK
ncbi:membrane protein insertase YidC [Sulfurihydrogenibium subterraneum]|uniref:membrane protein insertase YidC n=1 Tax=Sulfurihydrogenibium subterraneum TaxID=171121 RepID=UPI00048AAA45|nr:membrane protein insertase YidC [Sulfurihydrogenibium subterraneum]